MVRLIPEKKRRRSLSLNRAVLKDAKQIVVGLAVFILALALYAGLWVYGGILASSLDGLEADTRRLSSSLDQEAENSARLFARRLAQVGGLLDAHVYTSDIFALIQQVTHPRVQFIKFSFDEGDVALTGLTDGYVSFGQQIMVLEAHEDIWDLRISNISLNKKGEVTFRILFTVDTSVYHR